MSRFIVRKILLRMQNLLGAHRRTLEHLTESGLAQFLVDSILKLEALIIGKNQRFPQVRRRLIEHGILRTN